MIRILNVSKGRPNEARVALKTAWADSGGAIPTYLDLVPGAQVDVPAQSVSKWLTGTKQWLAEYVANGLIKVYTLASKHMYQDKGHNAIYGLDYLIDARFGPLAQSHALAMAVTLNTEIEAHFLDTAVHGGVAGNITAAAPTDLATLLTWITDAQTEYPTHITSIVAHITADAVNTLTPVAAADWATSIAALQELYRAYHSHKTWVDTAIEMDIATLLAYC